MPDPKYVNRVGVWAYCSFDEWLVWLSVDEGQSDDQIVALTPDEARRLAQLLTAAAAACRKPRAPTRTR